MIYELLKRRNFESAAVDASDILSVYTGAEVGFNALWSKYELWARDQDAANFAKALEDWGIAVAKRKLATEADRARHAALEVQYELELIKWRQRWPFFRGDMPSKPLLMFWPDYLFVNQLLMPKDYNYKTNTGRAQAEKQELTDMLQALDTGAKKFYMNEAQLKRMQAWESGDVVKAIKRRMKDSEQA